MLVDDSPFCNLIMQKTLARLPADLHINDFTNPLEALAQVPTLNPALIFLDLNMPELDGWGFLQRMRDTALTNQVIILTSSTSFVDRARAAEFTNVLSYQVKPPTKAFMDELLHLLQTKFQADPAD